MRHGCLQHALASDCTRPRADETLQLAKALDLSAHLRLEHIIHSLLPITPAGENVYRVVIEQTCDMRVEQPCRQPAHLPFCAYVWARP